MTKCKECGSDVSSKAAACPKCGAKPKKTSLLTKIVVGMLVVMALISISNDKQLTHPPAAQEPIAPRELTGVSDLSLDFEFAKSGFGVVAVINGTIQNSGPTNVKDIQIECQGYASSGTKLDTNKRTLYEAVASGKTLKFKDFSVGFVSSQVKSMNCSITGLTPN